MVNLINNGRFLKYLLSTLLLVGAGVAVASASVDSFVSGSIATISKTEGGLVLVNQGKYFVNAHAGQKLNPGDSVMTMSGAKALIAYTDGCTQQLKPNNKLVLNSAVECSLKTSKVQGAGPYYAAVGDIVIENPPPDNVNDDSGGTLKDGNGNPVLGGGVGGAGGDFGGGLGGLAAAAGLFAVGANYNNNRSASPD